MKPLSDQQLLEFKERGVVKVDFDLDPQFLDTIVAKVEPLYQDGSKDAAVRVQDAWKRVDEVRQLAIHGRVKAALEQLFERKALPFQTLNFPIGTAQSAHSDTLHFNCEPSGYMVGVWVALENIEEENGPLIYYPGSHLLPEYSMADFGLEAGYEHYGSYEQGIQELIQWEQLTPEFGIAKKGEAIIWHANLLHGGAPVTDPARTRHSQVTHYYFENCSYFTPMLSEPGKRRYRFPFWIPDSADFVLPEDRSILSRIARRVINKVRGS